MRYRLKENHAYTFDLIGALDFGLHTHSKADVRNTIFILIKVLMDKNVIHIEDINKAFGCSFEAFDE